MFSLLNFPTTKFSLLLSLNIPNNYQSYNLKSAYYTIHSRYLVNICLYSEEQILYELLPNIWRELNCLEKIL